MEEEQDQVKREGKIPQAPGALAAFLARCTLRSIAGPGLSYW